MMFSCGDKKEDAIVKKETENHLTYQNIKGEVKEIIETTFDAKEYFGETKKDSLKRKYKTQFNKKGNVTNFSKISKDGELYRKNEYKYDKDGNLTEENSYDFMNTDGG